MADSKEILVRVGEILNGLQFPEFEGGLTDLGFVPESQMQGGTLSVSIKPPVFDPQLQASLGEEIEAALSGMEGVSKVDLQFKPEVQHDGRTREGAAAGIRNVIAVASGKGGVGKSTVSVNLAVALAQNGAKVGLVDTDVYGPNVPRMMGVERLPQAPSPEGKLVPAEAYGVKLMSIGFLVKPEQAMVWRGPMLHNAIRQFIQDVEWGELDYLIIDMPPGTGDIALTLSQLLPLTGAVVVCTPQKVAQDDATRAAAMFKQLGIDVLGVVEK